MTTEVGRPAPSPNILAALYEPIQAELAQAEDLLRRELRSQHPFVDELVKHGFRLGGKRLRPALVLLTARAAGQITPAHRTLAAVVEMIHTATLVHDDILDEADLRRHLETANSRWGNEASVLLGDFLFSHAFYLASSLDDAYACRVIGRSTNIVCEGELRQINSRGAFDTTEEEYLAIIDAKTAELTACCCRLGGHYAGASDEAVDALERYGRDLGVAFQIADDVLDLIGEESAAGKSLGTDLEKRKPTLPLIRLLKTLPGDDRLELRELLARTGGLDRAGIVEWIGRGDGIEYARDVACRYAASAREQLTRFGRSPAVAALAEMTRLVIDRPH
ncbi:MAG: polyprenyl synthetase family protein [Pirellulales bacterium]|nr:polyprenyl synthetase family protein [Pirellulales bacterium]